MLVVKELGDGILTGGGVSGMGTICGGTPGIARGPPIEITLLPPTDRSFLGTGGGLSR